MVSTEIAIHSLVQKQNISTFHFICNALFSDGMITPINYPCMSKGYTIYLINQPAKIKSQETRQIVT